LAMPILLLLMILFGSSSGHMSRFKNLRQVKLMTRQLIKHSQLLGIIANIRVSWPVDLANVFEFCSLLSTQLEQLFQTGCLASQQTATSSLLIKWLAPLGLAAVVAATVLFSQLFAFIISMFPGCQAFADFIRQDLNSFIVFSYVLWAIYFATLTSNALLIFNCKVHPNGDYSVQMYPDVICGSEEYWVLAVGGFLSLFFYVGMFFFVSHRAVKLVHETLLATSLESRGALEFSTEGLRVSRLRYNIYAAAKDVSIAVVVAILSFSAAAQLLVSAVILTAWAMLVLLKKPLDTWACNSMEMWSSMGLAVMMILSAGLGFGDNSGEDIFTVSDNSDKAVLLAIVLVGGLGVPILLLVFEIVTQIPCCHRRLPKRWQQDGVEEEVGRFQQAVAPEDLFSMMHMMDEWEWAAFLDSIGEERANFREKKQSNGADKLSDDKNPEEKTNQRSSVSSDLSSLRQRAILQGRLTVVDDADGATPNTPGGLKLSTLKKNSVKEEDPEAQHESRKPRGSTNSYEPRNSTARRASILSTFMNGPEERSSARVSRLSGVSIEEEPASGRPSLTSETYI